MAAYRAGLDEIRAKLGPVPEKSEPLSIHKPHERFVLEWNDKRLAVLDRDIEAIIRIHARDRKVEDEVLDTLNASPRDAVVFAQRALTDVHLAWTLAHSLGLGDDRTWSDLIEAYEKVDPLAVLPVLTGLVERELVTAYAKHYRNAARRLARMRKLAACSYKAAAEVDDLISGLRETRRRPRLQQEFDKAKLP